MWNDWGDTIEGCENYEEAEMEYEEVEETKGASSKDSLYVVA